MKEFANLVKNKNVLLVGNGSSVLEKDYSKAIDSYEFVIRFNYAIEEFHKFQYCGKKIDAWFYSIKDSQRCISVYNNAKIKAKHCIRHDYDPINIGEYQYHIPKPFRRKFNESLNLVMPKKASTGLCAINYLIEYCNTKSITLIGFDSFNTGNYYNKKNIASKWHKGDVEKTYINKLRSENKIKFLDND